MPARLLTTGQVDTKYLSPANVVEVSMEGYLGETPVTSLKGTPFEDYDAADWALEYAARYGQINGDHHTMWVIDQMARILLGTPVKVVVARWENGQYEYRISTADPSQDYLAWVEEMKGDVDPETGETEYGYDEGIAP